MAVIVGIHGIAQQYRGGHQLGATWYEAIRDGLAAADYRGLADGLARDAVRVAYFGDLFRPPGAMSTQDPPFGPADIQPGLERDLLTEFYSAAVVQDPSLGPPEGAMGVRDVAVQLMLNRLLRSATFARVAQRALVGNLKQVTRFLTDPPAKQRVLERTQREVTADTRVLIGHSLGSVIAYEYLCQYRPPSIELLVTLGSPLGIPRLVFDRLTPAPVDGKGVWPAAIGFWVNVADANDVVALRKQLASLFAGVSPDTSVEDRLVDNGDEPHAIDRYLNARHTGSALGDVLG